jgi:hypothetical protein
MLSVPPTGSPFDKGDVPNLPWKNWMQDAYRHAKKYQGSGTTAQRPINGVEEGDWYFDTTIGRPVWYISSAWTDIAERATSAEIKTGTDAAKIITPANLLAALGITSHYNSGNQTITSAGSLTLSHGLGREPLLINTWLKCLTAENGYSIGQKLSTESNNSTAVSDNKGHALVVDNTSIYIKFGSLSSVYSDLHWTTGLGIAFTNANWALIVEAWA